MSLTLVCQNAACGQSFQVFQSDLENNRGKYCCRQCYYAGRTIPLDRRLWSKIQQCEHAPICLYCCWPFLGHLNNKGYGDLGQNKERSSLAHRLAWEEWNKKIIPAHLDACHYCHNTYCCNPLHIHPGTRKENMAESAMQQRHIFGSKSHLSKLTEDDIPTIFSMYHDGISINNIARYFNISGSAIQNVIARKNWKESSHSIESREVEKNKYCQKLTDNDIPLILSMCDAGEKYTAIAKHFNVTRHTISLIIKGKIWTHISR